MMLMGFTMVTAASAANPAIERRRQICVKAAQLGARAREQARLRSIHPACGSRRAVVLRNVSTEIPPLLYSFPGSGNTWVRLLLEQASSAPTASRYLDPSIAAVMPHECDNIETRSSCAGFVAIKVHPTFAGSMAIDSGSGRANFVGANLMCGGAIAKAIFLVRHPMTAFWSDYQRKRLHRAGRAEHNHHSAITTAAWPKIRPAWEREASQVYAVEYRDMWRPEKMSYGRWLQDHLGSTDTEFLKFEELIDKDRRIDALRRTVSFSGFEVDNRTLECAFLHADEPAMHRPRGPNLVDATVAWRPQLLDTVWPIVGEHASKLGYGKDNWRRTALPPIGRVDLTQWARPR